MLHTALLGAGIALSALGVYHLAANHIPAAFKGILSWIKSPSLRTRLAALEAQLAPKTSALTGLSVKPSGPTGA